MKKFWTLGLLAFLFFAGLTSCSDDSEEPTLVTGDTITGRYRVNSAIFQNEVPLLGTDATLLINQVVLGASNCLTDETLLEFAENGTVNLVCSQASAATLQLGTWAFNEATSVLSISNINIQDVPFNSLDLSNVQIGASTISATILDFVIDSDLNITESIDLVLGRVQ